MLLADEQLIWVSHYKTKQQGALEFCFDVFHTNVSENTNAFSVTEDGLELLFIKQQNRNFK